MIGEPWLYGSMVATTVLYLGVFLYARYRSSGDRAPAEADHGTVVEGTLVACPSCGVDNERGYRFCRRCVTELPGAVSDYGPSDLPRGRGIV